MDIQENTINDKSEAHRGVWSKMEARDAAEDVVGTLVGGNGLTFEEAEGFCGALHSDAAIEYRDGIVAVMAIRVPKVI